MINYEVMKKGLVEAIKYQQSIVDESYEYAKDRENQRLHWKVRWADFKIKKRTHNLLKDLLNEITSVEQSELELIQKT